MCDNVKQDFKYEVREAITLLHDIIAFRSVDNSGKETLEKLVKYMDNVTSCLGRVLHEADPISPCRNLNEARQYVQIAKDFYTSLQETCTIIGEMSFEAMFHDLHEDMPNTTIQRIAELYAIAKGYMCSVKKWCVDNNTDYLLLANKEQYETH